MYHVQDTLADYALVFTSLSKRKATDALRRLRTAYPLRDYRLVTFKDGWWTVLA